MVNKVYSYTSTPPMGRTACTEPQCMYKGALYLTFTLPQRGTETAGSKVVKVLCYKSEGRWFDP